MDLIERGLVCEGLSFHVGSLATNVENYVQAISLAASVFEEAKERGYTKMNLLDIGGGFSAPYDETVKPFQELAAILNSELDRLSPKDVQIGAEPGRFMVATPANARPPHSCGRAQRLSAACIDRHRSEKGALGIVERRQVGSELTVDPVPPRPSMSSPGTCLTHAPGCLHHQGCRRGLRAHSRKSCRHISRSIAGERQPIPARFHDPHARQSCASQAQNR